MLSVTLPTMVYPSHKLNFSHTLNLFVWHSFLVYNPGYFLHLHFWYHIVISQLQLSGIASRLFLPQVLFLIQFIQFINNIICSHYDLLIMKLYSFSHKHRTLPV